MTIKISDKFTERLIERVMKRRGIKTKARAARELLHERFVDLGYISNISSKSKAQRPRDTESPSAA